MASQVIQIDFAQPLPTLRIHRRGELLLLVKFGLQPIGWVRVDSKRFGRTIAPTILGQIIADALPRQILDAARTRAFEPPRRGQSLSFSMIVATPKESPRLERLVQSIALLDYPRFEVIVVDRPKANSSIADVCSKFAFVHRVIEPRPGLGYALNTGWQVARNEIVAYVDADTTVDPGLLSVLADNFADVRVDGATAVRLPTAFNSSAARAFTKESLGNEAFIRRTFVNRSWSARLWLDLARATAANSFAVRRSTLAAMNGFDPAITRGHALDLFTRVVRDGGQIAFDPRASVLEQKRTTLTTLARGAFHFGFSLAECCNKYFDDAELANVAAMTLHRWTRDRFRSGRPLAIAVGETTGAFAATRAYRRSLRHVRNETKRFVQKGIVRRAA